MKCLSILVASAAVAAAQFGDLPGCGQVCMNNMNEIAVNDFNCTQGDILCYCQKVDYGYGVRDCATEACPDSSEAAAVISYGSSYCAGAVASAAPSTPSAPGYSILSSAAGGSASGTGPSPTGTAGNETGTGGAGGLSTPVSTVTGTATFTSGSQAITTTGAISTIFSTATGSIASSLSSVVSSVNSSLASKASGAASSASATGSAIESSLTASASASASATNASSTSQGGAPVATAAPLLGAGAMALLLAAL